MIIPDLVWVCKFVALVTTLGFLIWLAMSADVW